MPGKNTIKEYAPENYYHVYNRGVEKRKIFLDEEDYTVFLGLIKKYLTGTNKNLKNRHLFNNLGTEVSLLSYCLMPNHFHLLLFQKTSDGITKLMRRVTTGYVMYFNNKYDRVGGLFQGRYKAAHINGDTYLHHISRYIHLNPDNYKNWPYSSYSYYLGQKNAKWLDTSPILSLFEDSPAQYSEFVDDYAEAKKEIDILKYQLADNGDM